MISDYLDFKELKEIILERRFRGRSGIIQKFHEPLFENECSIIFLFRLHTSTMDPEGLSHRN